MIRCGKHKRQSGADPPKIKTSTQKKIKIPLGKLTPVSKPHTIISHHLLHRKQQGHRPRQTKSCECTPSSSHTLNHTAHQISRMGVEVAESHTSETEHNRDKARGEKMRLGLDLKKIVFLFFSLEILVLKWSFGEKTSVAVLSSLTAFGRGRCGRISVLSRPLHAICLSLRDCGRSRFRQLPIPFCHGRNT